MKVRAQLDARGRRRGTDVNCVLPLGDAMNLLVRTLLALLVACLLPGAAVAQGAGDSAHINGRLSELQRTLAALSTQLEQLKAQNQQLQQRLEKMQTSFGQRIERLEKAPAAQPASKPVSKPAPKPVPQSGTPKQ